MKRICRYSNSNDPRVQIAKLKKEIAKLEKKLESVPEAFSGTRKDLEGALRWKNELLRIEERVLRGMF